jgi:hypothetical protein
MHSLIGSIKVETADGGLVVCKKSGSAFSIGMAGEETIQLQLPPHSLLLFTSEQLVFTLVSCLLPSYIYYLFGLFSALTVVVGTLAPIIS